MHENKSSPRPRVPASPRLFSRQKAGGTAKPLPRRRIKRNKPPKVKKNQGGWSVTLGVIAATIASGGIIVGGIWLGILTLVDPNAIIWINQFLPAWTRIPITYASPPQTLAAIEDEIRSLGRIPGEPLYLDSQQTFLLPILVSVPNCSTSCRQIVELRVYEPVESHHKDKSYWLITDLPIKASSSNSTNDDDFSGVLPFKTLSRFENDVPAEGLWFKLAGEIVSSSSLRSYGQVIHYNPDRQHLSVMLQWQSPNELQPDWRQVTGTSTPEFIVDQTVGLEPQFKVYQLQPRKFVPNPIALEEISLTTPAIESQVYRDALLLARHGLWTPAGQLLKSQEQKDWSAAAQAQMDVIQLHAQVTQAQSKKTWASPSSSILAHLIDGRWGDALVVFQNTPIDTQLYEIGELLKTDSGRLWERMEAALKVNPQDQNIQAWGALMIGAKQNTTKAIAWLQTQQPSATADNSRFYQLLDLLDLALAKESFISSHLSKIIGHSQPVKNVNLVDWLQPTYQTLPIQIEPEQIWYEIRVRAFHDGKRWRYQPFSDLQLPTVAQGKQLWKYLGLDTDSRIQVTVWTPEGKQESQIASVKAASFKEGSIQLLAVGEALPTTGQTQPSQFLAHTKAALRWLDPNSTSLWALNQQQPEWISAILPVLKQELVNSGREAIIPASAQSADNSSLQTILEDLANWSVRPIDLTGNNQPEAVLTIYEDRKPRTLIFADTGELLYSEFSKDATTSLTAIADLEDGKPPALLINSPSTYSFQRWSVEGKRFEGISGIGN
ncbi:MAG: hypothetical protein F6K47_33260 [Symploca sp. SIO2E6]|nr:hypothetical protein [Symploca sp. SIO2E6]